MTDNKLATIGLIIGSIALVLSTYADQLFMFFAIGVLAVSIIMHIILFIQRKKELHKLYALYKEDIDNNWTYINPSFYIADNTIQIQWYFKYKEVDKFTYHIIIRHMTQYINNNTKWDPLLFIEYLHRQPEDIEIKIVTEEDYETWVSLVKRLD